MSGVTIWKNVAVDMQSVIGSTVAISAITKADPAVVTATGHGLSNGDIIYAEALGMRQVNERAFRVSGVSGDDFALEGIDSTAFDDFTSGTIQKVTLGTSITTATDINGSGGDFDFIDTTTIHDNTKTQVPGLPSAISYSMTHHWNISDAGQVAMKEASDAQARRVIKFTFGTGGKIMIFAGYCGFAGLPGGSAQDKVTTTGVFTLNGTPCYYAS